MADRTALVVGARGVVGTNLIEHLAADDGWDVIGLSRRGGADGLRTAGLVARSVPHRGRRERTATLRPPDLRARPALGRPSRPAQRRPEGGRQRPHRRWSG